MSNLIRGKLSCCMLVLYIAFSYAEQAPAYIKPCLLADKECVIKSIQAAVPIFVKGNSELGLTSLDPFEQKELKINLAGLQMDLQDLYVTGLGGCIIDDIKMDEAKMKHTLEYHCDIDLKAKYKMNGRLLVLPIQGDGDAEANIKKMKIKLSYNYELVKGPDGKEYMHVKNHKYSWKFLDNVHIDFTNLFNGNKELASTTLAFLNANWQAVSSELGPVFMKLVVDKIVDNIKIFYGKIPVEQLQLLTQ